jgi:hypothetical protein
MPTVPASATVTYNGDPVAGATVTLSPQGAGKPAHGVTDASGTTALTTYEDGDGAVVGSYKVSVTKVEGAGAADEEMSEEEYTALAEKMMATDGSQEEPAAAGPTSALPERYGSFETSGLEAEVKEGADNNLSLTLTDE